MRDRRRGVRALLRPPARAARHRHGGARARTRWPAARAGATAASCSPAWPRSTTTPASASAPSARVRCTRARSPRSRTCTSWPRSSAPATPSGGSGCCAWPCRRTRPSTCAATREALREDGFPGEVVEHDELPAALRRGGLVALPHRERRRAPPGALVPPAGRAPPRRPARGSARAARCAGRCPRRTRARVVTDGGSVRARHVVVAADGALPALVPEYAGRVRPRRLHMIATAPLPPAFDTLVYARWGYEYLQQRPDGRILGGGFSDVDADDSYTDSDAGSPAMWERIERYLREELGADPEVTHRWAGRGRVHRGRAPVRRARCPAAPGLYVSGGYSGVGNVPGFMCGRDLADTIAGDGPEPLFPSTASHGPAALRELSAREASASRSARAPRRRCSGARSARWRAAWRRPIHRREPWPVYLDARRGRARLGRGRQRVPRLPQRLQRDGPGPRAPGDRWLRSRGASGSRHPLRRHHRGGRGGGRGARAPLRPRRAGASPTRAPSRSWTRSALARARSPGATAS